MTMRAVITFHSIDDRSGPLSYPPAALEAMIDALANSNIPILPLDQLLGNPNAKGVALTFDDGISTVFSTALPILRDREVPAHVFVITNWVGGDNLWPGQPAKATSFKLMDWDQLGAIQAAGFRIEAHTASHPDLRALSEAEIEAEMEESDAAIESHLGRRPQFFAYPYGYHDARVRSLAGKRYKGCFTTRLDYLAASDAPAALPRLDSHYLRSARLVGALPSKSTHAYIGLRRALRRLRGH
jgi:peptidoglycan/xylan/chitin deacetylase (PgdA/CDA1 family)